MSSPLFDRLPPDRNPLTNTNIERPKALADLMRCFSSGFNLGRLGYTAKTALSVCQHFEDDVGCDEWAIWAKAGYIYGRSQKDDGSPRFSTNEAIKDWIKYRETGQSEHKQILNERFEV